MSIKGIERRCKWFDTATNEDINQYISNLNRHNCGQSKIIDSDDCLGHIQDSIDSNPATTIQKIYYTLLA
jgi:hypothetical protein